MIMIIMMIFQPIDLRAVAQTCSRLSEVTIFISLIIIIINMTIIIIIVLHDVDQIPWKRRTFFLPHHHSSQNPSSLAGLRVPLPQSRVRCSGLGTATRCRTEEDALQLGWGLMMNMKMMWMRIRIKMMENLHYGKDWAVKSIGQLGIWISALVDIHSITH